MGLHDDYLQKVTDQIRWKALRPKLAEELQMHLLDQQEAFLAEGMTEEEAAEAACREMGDPVALGQQLDGVHRPKPQWGLLIFTLLLLFTGAMLNRWVGVETGLENGGFATSLHWMAAYALGAAVVLAAYFIDITRIPYLSMVFCGGLFLCYMLTVAISGPLQWVSPVAVTYAGLLIPLMTASLILAKPGGSGRMVSLLLLSFGLGMLTVGYGSASAGMAAAGISLCVIFLALMRGQFDIPKQRGILILFFFGTILSLGMLLILITTGRWYDFLTHLSPELDPNGRGFLPLLLRDIMAGTVFMGQGTLPEGITDFSMIPIIGREFLLTYLAYRFGWWVMAAAGIAGAGVLILGLFHTIRERNETASLIIFTVTMTFAFQIIEYLLANLGYGGLSPLSLPFLSFSRWGIVINAVLMGVLLSVFRRGEALTDHGPLTQKKRRLYIEGNRLIFEFRD